MSSSWPPGTPDDVITIPEGPERDEHLTYEEMEQYVDDVGSSVSRELVEGHVATCALCRNELADLTGVRAAMRARTPQPARRWWAVAAAVAVLSLIAAWFSSRTATTGTPVQRPAARPAGEMLRAHVAEVLRTGSVPRPAIVAALNPTPPALLGPEQRRPRFSLLHPVGTVVLDAQPLFRWTPLADARSYEITIADRDSGAIASSGTARDAQWRPPGALPRGRTYTWQVAAHAGRQIVTEPRPPVPEALFRVAGDGEATEAESLRTALPVDAHLDLGVLFAERGLLDDAERELQSARDRSGPAVLARVRSWRSYSPSPTTTKAAQ